MVVLAEVWLLFNKQQLIVTRHTTPVYALNEVSTITINLKKQGSRKLNCRLIDEVPYQFGLRNFVLDLSLQQAEENVHYTLKPQIRGEYQFNDIHAFVSTFLHLVQKRETTPLFQTIAVYPSVPMMFRQELLALKHPSFTTGSNLNYKPGRSYEFDQLKIYQPGDDTRTINWKATSAKGETMVNKYIDEQSQQVYAIIDKSRVMKMPFGGLTLVDYAINATLSLTNIILKKQDKAGLLLFSGQNSTIVKANKGPMQLQKILYALHKEQYDYSEADYQLLYRNIRVNITNRSLLFLFTSFDSIYSFERRLPLLKLIHQHHLLVVIFFENNELKFISEVPPQTLFGVYEQTIAQKAILEKEQIKRELTKHGIQVIQCEPSQLNTSVINKYLELKLFGRV